MYLVRFSILLCACASVTGTAPQGMPTSLRSFNGRTALSKFDLLYRHTRRIRLRYRWYVHAKKLPIGAKGAYAGGGTAGLVVAARLSEDPTITVAVVEAGVHHVNEPLVDTPREFTACK